APHARSDCRPVEDETPRIVVRVRSGGNHDRRDDRADFLLPGRAARRAEGSQHSLLEVAAGFRHHDSSFEGEHSACDFAGIGIWSRDRHRIRNVGVEQRRFGAKWIEPRTAVDAAFADARCIVAALSHDYRARSLVRADYLLAAVDIGVGAPCRSALGRVASVLHWDARKAGVQHHAFCDVGAVPLQRRNGGRDGPRDHADESDDALDSRTFSINAGTVAGMDCCGVLSGVGCEDSAKPRTELGVSYENAFADVSHLRRNCWTSLRYSRDGFPEGISEARACGKAIRYSDADHGLRWGFAGLPEARARQCWRR